MTRIVTYGIGGYDPNKPNNNIIEIIETEDDEGMVEPPVVEPPVVEATDSSNVQQIAEALSQLPEEQLTSLKQALGLN